MRGSDACRVAQKASHRRRRTEGVAQWASLGRCRAERVAQKVSRRRCSAEGAVRKVSHTTRRAERVVQKALRRRRHAGRRRITRRRPAARAARPPPLRGASSLHPSHHMDHVVFNAVPGWLDVVTLLATGTYTCMMHHPFPQRLVGRQGAERRACRPDPPCHKGRRTDDRCVKPYFIASGRHGVVQPHALPDAAQGVRRAATHTAHAGRPAAASVRLLGSSRRSLLQQLLPRRTSRTDGWRAA